MKNKKLIIGAVVAVLVLVGLVGAFAAMGGDDESSSSTTPSLSDNASMNDSNASESGDKPSSYEKLVACDLLSEADATAIFGAAATKGESELKPIGSSQIDTDTCGYTTADGMQTISIGVRSANDEAGFTVVSRPYGDAAPSSAEAVSGYGDKAYFKTTTKTLNILKDNSSIEIEREIGGRSFNTTLDQVKQVADKLKF